MNFVTCSYKNEEFVGIENSGYITAVNDILAAAEEKNICSMLELIDAFSLDSGLYTRLERTDLSRFNSLSPREVQLKAPIPYPRRNIFCLGKNYAAHANEVQATKLSGSGIPTSPVYFTKTAMPALEHGGEIRFYASATQQVDYEAELAVIIGKQGINIRPEDAKEYIFGYTILNDVSARDLQVKHEQWFKGKNLDTFCPMGPVIVYKNDIPFPAQLDITCHVNGILRQNDNTKSFIFDLPYIISDLSKGLTLYPGDIISTGTPAGVGAGAKPPRFLNDGDKVECTIEKIGTLTNIVKVIY